MTAVELVLIAALVAVWGFLGWWKHRPAQPDEWPSHCPDEVES